MQLSRASRYGILAVLYVARGPANKPISGTKISAACGFPETYLVKILQRLVQQHVLASEAGRNGGFLLEKSAERITLLEIIEAIDGPLAQPEPMGTDGLYSRLLIALERDLVEHARKTLGSSTVASLLAVAAPATT